jgi:hypothetical protein
MNGFTYNISMLIGVALVGTGVGMVSVPAALVTVGGLVIILTFAGAYLAGRKG